MKVHKLSFFKKKNGDKQIAMLCRPSQTGKNTDAKSVNWDNVNCARCLAFKKNENLITTQSFPEFKKVIFVDDLIVSSGETKEQG